MIKVIKGSKMKNRVILTEHRQVAYHSNANDAKNSKITFLFMFKVISGHNHMFQVILGSKMKNRVLLKEHRQFVYHSNANDVKSSKITFYKGHFGSESYVSGHFGVKNKKIKYF